VFFRPREKLFVLAENISGKTIHRDVVALPCIARNTCLSARFFQKRRPVPALFRGYLRQ